MLELGWKVQYQQGDQGAGAEPGCKAGSGGGSRGQGVGVRGSAGKGEEKEDRMYGAFGALRGTGLFSEMENHREVLVRAIKWLWFSLPPSFWLLLR